MPNDFCILECINVIVSIYCSYYIKASGGVDLVSLRYLYCTIKYSSNADTYLNVTCYIGTYFIHDNMIRINN